MLELDVWEVTSLRGPARHVGVLRGEYGNYSFRYDPKAEAPVSRTMPLGKEYETQCLPPVFDQNLPEGVLRDFLINLIRKNREPGSNEDESMELLGIVGHNAIGRIRLTAGRRGPRNLRLRDGDAEEILNREPADELVQDFLELYAANSGVSGVQPKVLLNLDAGADLPGRGELRTLPFGHYLLKLDTGKFPFLVMNEHLCLKAARAAGIHVVDTRVSDFGDRMLIRRFDIDGNDVHRFEEACTLRVKPSFGKYDDTYEAMCRTLVQALDPRERERAAEQLFRQIVFVVLTRNGDAHLKNFGILSFNGEDRWRLAPAYDLVTTTCYLPRDTPALGFECMNGAKRWPDRKALLRFAGLALEIPSRRADVIVRETGDVLRGQVEGIQAEVKDFRSAGVDGFVSRIKSEWERGIRDVSPEVMSGFVPGASP